MSEISAVTGLADDAGGADGADLCVSLAFALIRLPSLLILIRSMTDGRVIECQRSIVSMIFDKISGSAVAAPADVTVDVSVAPFLRRKSGRVLLLPIERVDDITSKPSRFTIELFKSTSSSLSSGKYSSAFGLPKRCNFGYSWPIGRVARELVLASIASDAAAAFKLPRVICLPAHFFAFRLTLRRRLITFLVLLILNLLSKLSTSYSST